jgi:predicted 3-demethylubiquinone-9 3-methyltransferase (glyoxalase superfamily)
MRKIQKQAKNTICLWYDGDAEDAARFYAKAFPDSSVGAVHLAPGDFPSGKKGDVLTVEFTVMGIPCLGLNGGPAFKHNEAFSFQVATADQAESSATAAKRVRAVGARTNGACPGRLRRSL